MEKINAIKGGTEVQVNDNGDTIVCNFGSQEFCADFTELIDNLEKVKKYVATEEFTRKPEIEQLRIMIGRLTRSCLTLTECSEKGPVRRYLGRSHRVLF